MVHGPPYGQIVYYIILGLGLLVELGLAAYVIHRARGLLAGRFLLGSLLFHALSLVVSFVIILLGLAGYDLTLPFDLYPHRHQFIVTLEDGGPQPATLLDHVTFWAPFLLAWIPAFDVGFALSYPRRQRWVLRRPWVLVVPFLVPAILTAYALGHSAKTARADYWEFLRNSSEWATFAIVAYILAGSLVTAAIFRAGWTRARWELEARRLEYMYRRVSIPMVCISAAWLVLLLIDVALGGFTLPFLYAAVAAYALYPPIAMGVGLLRFRILDWDRGLRRTARFTVSYGLITTLFAAAFFVASESAEYALQSSAGSAWVGLAAAGLLALAARPLHRAADRFARRVVREPRDVAREARRREIYRAAFEDLAAEGKLSRHRKRSLQEFGRTLGLGEAEIRRIEGEATQSG